MSLIDSLRNCLDALEVPHEPTFRAVVFGEHAVYLENVKNIIGFDSNEIVVMLKSGCLRIYGSCLTVKKYCLGDLVVCGKIKGIEKI